MNDDEKYTISSTMFPLVDRILSSDIELEKGERIIFIEEDFYGYNRNIKVAKNNCIKNKKRDRELEIKIAIREDENFMNLQ